MQKQVPDTFQRPELSQKLEFPSDFPKPKTPHMRSFRLRALQNPKIHANRQPAHIHGYELNTLNPAPSINSPIVVE